MVLDATKGIENFKIPLRKHQLLNEINFLNHSSLSVIYTLGNFKAVLRFSKLHNISLVYCVKLQNAV